eukprot:3127790-Pyramimonas_sp.AAC.1
METGTREELERSWTTYSQLHPSKADSVQNVSAFAILDTSQKRVGDAMNAVAPEAKRQKTTDGDDEQPHETEPFAVIAATATE